MKCVSIKFCIYEYRSSIESKTEGICDTVAGYYLAGNV
jgi:hypothetical protein